MILLLDGSFSAHTSRTLQLPKPIPVTIQSAGFQWELK